MICSLKEKPIILINVIHHDNAINRNISKQN